MLNKFSLIILIFLFVSCAVQSFQPFSSIMTTKKLNLEMKGKGKKIPIEQRGEYMKRQRIMEAQAEYEKNKPKGVPIFKVSNLLKSLLFSS
jgi:hypothetical protein